MVAILDPLIIAFSCIFLLILWRALWLHGERRKLARMPSSHDAERFDPKVEDDERDKMYSGRVIKRMRSRVVDGRVEIHWEYHPEFIHRGFVLTGKGRYEGGEWQPLAFEPFEDNGRWSEDFKYGETRSYLFVVKKKYRFFFGLFDESPTEIIYDQITIPVRKGRYHKEVAEYLEDRRNVAAKGDEYMKAVEAGRKTARRMKNPEKEMRVPESGADKAERRLRERSELADRLEKRRAEILAHPSWTEERKRKEIEALEEAFDEMKFDE